MQGFILTYYEKVMNLSAAYDILELQRPATIEDVSVSFRRLLKQYHPDRNIHRSEWSHAMTIRLNEAYEVAITHLRENNGTERDEAVVAEKSPRADRGDIRQGEFDFDFEPWQDAEADTGYSVALHTRMGTLFDLLLDQVYAYYTYGLDNLYLRNEGTLRYRYRATLRRLNTLITDIRLCLEWPAGARQKQQVEAVVTFATGFYENALIKPKNHAVLSGEERKAYRLYRAGAEALDQAIKRALFGSHFGGHGGYSSPRSVCEQSLVLLLAQYPKSAFVAEALIKMFLLQGYDALVEHVLE